MTDILATQQDIEDIIMIRDITVCYHFLNVLILISLVMIIMIAETDIVPSGLSRRLVMSHRKPFDYEHESLNSRQPKVFKDSTFNKVTHLHQRVIYKSHNDTFLPLLTPSMMEEYGGFQEVGGMSGVFAYSANFDYRAKPPGIQVVVISPIPNITSEFVCVLYVSVHLDDPVRVMGQLKFFPEPNWKYTYRSGTVFCPLTKEGFRPPFLSLLSSEEDPVHNVLPVRYPKYRKYNLTRCYPAFHSTFSNVSSVIWNIEISRVFGVEKFIFYNFDTNETVSKVLLQYQQDGLAEVRNWHLPVDYRRLHYWGQLAAMHDCFFSQVGQTRFLLFTDIDELVIPRKVTSLVRLAEDLLFDTTFTNKMFGALVFRNVFFPIILPKGKDVFQGRAAAEAFDISPLLHTIHSRVHTAYDRSKLLVIPEAIEFLWIHAVEKFRKDWIPRVVDGDVARLHHYRYIPAVDMRPPWEPDKLLLRYSVPIVKAVRRRFAKLKKFHLL